MNTCKISVNGTIFFVYLQKMILKALNFKNRKNKMEFRIILQFRKDLGKGNLYREAVYMHTGNM